MSESDDEFMERCIDTNQREHSSLRSETFQNAAHAVCDKLPDTHGFILIVAPWGDGPGFVPGD